MQLEVKQIDAQTFEVFVQGSSPTRHLVTVPAEYVAKLAGEGTAADELIRRSFEFLLEREPNTSILRSFELRVIQSYFPEYEAEMTARFGA